MKKKRRKHLLHFIGATCVGFWLLMLGLLIGKIHFAAPPLGGHLDAFRSIESAQREWKEIFLKDRKVGYAVGMIKPFAEGYYIQEEIFLRLNLAGSRSGLYSLTQAQVNENFQVQDFRFVMTSGLVRFNISGRMEGDHLVLSTGRGEKARAQRIKMEHPPMLAAGVEYFLRSRKIRVGESFRLPLLDPATMTQKEAVMRVTGKENLTIHHIGYEAYRLEAEVWGKPFIVWIDEQGVTLKEEGFMGLTLVRSSPGRAVAPAEGEEAMDLYEITAVRPDRTLRDPTRVRTLKLGLEGFDEKPFLAMGIHGGRQRVDERILTVTKESLPLSSSYSIPFPGSDWAKPFLEPEFNVESDDPGIIRKAKEICGAEKDPLRAARRLLQWVYGHLEKRPVLSVPSALETLRTGVGDCNEHATLLTALLRAVGIPARLCIGLVYSREKFYYHAWTEAYLGDWISMDATLNQMPADATHVKFVEGNLEKQLEMVRVMETLALKVISFEHD